MNKVNRYSLRILTLFLLVFVTRELYAQDYQEALGFFFLQRQPSAKAEAMGQGLVASESGGFASFYNPAGITLNKGLKVSLSQNGPAYLARDANYKFVGVTYQLASFGYVGLSMYRYNWGEFVITGPDGPDPLGSYNPTTTLFRLTYAKEVLSDLYVGANIGLIRDNRDTVPTVKASTMQIDLGLLRSFKLDANQRVLLGVSLFNLTQSKIAYLNDEQKDALPVILNAGGSWQMFIGHATLNSYDVSTLRLVFQLEYQYLLNSDYHNGFKGGFEFGFVEMLFLRIGGYQQDINNYGNPEYNKDALKDFTYGVGVKLPLSKMLRTNIPDLKLDFTRLKQPSFIKPFDDWDDFSVFSLSVNWGLGN